MARVSPPPWLRPWEITLSRPGWLPRKMVGLPYLILRDFSHHEVRVHGVKHRYIFLFRNTTQVQGKRDKKASNDL